MPSAMPLTTLIPAAASPRPNSAATSSPYGVARRAPTTATAGATPSSVRRSASRPGSPATCRTAGASSRSISGAGYQEPCRQTAPSPAAAIASQAPSALERLACEMDARCRCARRAPRRGPRRPARAVLRTPPARARRARCAGRRDRAGACAAGRGRRRQAAARAVLLALEVVRSAKSDRLEHVPVLDAIAALEVGDGAGDPQHATVPAGAQRPVRIRVAQRLAGAEGKVGRAGRHGLRHVRVAARPRAGQPRRLALPGGEDLLANGRRGRERRRGQHLLVGTLHADVEVDAVEQRAAEPPAVAVVIRSGALAGLVPAPARARVRGGDEHEAGRQQRRALPAHDRHLPVLQRLAQRLQRRPRELRQLVEEQDAVMGEARLPRAGMRPAADEAGRGDRVVRSAERPLGDEASTATAQAGEAVDAGDLQRLVARQGRQDPAEPPRQHRLAGPRRADEQRVVAAGSRDRQRADRRGLPADVAQVLDVGAPAHRGKGPARSAGGASPRRIAATPARSPTPATATPSTSPASAAHSRGTMSPSSPCRRAPSATASAPATRAQLAAEGQLAEDRPAVDALRGHLAAGDEQAARRREVVSRSRLREVRGREVDRDAPVRELEAGVADRGVHALARLTHGGVAAADDGEPREAGAQIDLDGDPPRGEAVDGEGGEAGEHVPIVERRALHGTRVL